VVADADYRMRKLNAQANGSAPTPTSGSQHSTPLPSPSREEPSSESNIVTIDPGAKARAAASAGGGGAIEPVLDVNGNVAPTSKPTLSFQEGQSPWSVVVSEILPNLRDPGWQIRHGSSLALLELLRNPSVSTSIHTRYLTTIARELLILLVLDRFGDFVGDTVIAPVRETAGQALGILLKFLSDETVMEVHQAFLAMVRQPWAKRGKDEAGNERKEGEKFRWEVRHAGLLGIKYEVAVRGDLLVPTVSMKSEGGKGDVKPQVGSLLHDIVDATILA
jgi:TATA-binding protein-associated factor